MSGSFAGRRLALMANVFTVRRSSAPSGNILTRMLRRVVDGLVLEINTGGRPMNCGAMTVAQLCDHFAQRELSKDNSWRSHATKKIYQAYLIRWIRPHWQQFERAATSKRLYRTRAELPRLRSLLTENAHPVKH
jgi:hypothetical protein